MFENILNPVYLIIGVLILVCIILIILVIGKKDDNERNITGGRLADKEKWLSNLEDFSMGKLLEVRILNGVEASINYASKFKKSVVIKISNLDVLHGSLEESNEEKRLKENLDFLERYESKYCTTQVLQEPSLMKSFLDEMR